MSTLPDGLVAFGPDANCTLSLCPLEASLLGYKPSMPASIVCLSIFGLSLIVHAYQGFRGAAWGFMASMISGCIMEIVGYVGRIILEDNPFDFAGFLIQIICITIAPVFYCSAIYVTLSQVINSVDRSLSRCQPRFFYWIFIPCDVISLVLQAAGGALSVVASNKDDVQVGVDISLAGLIFQVITLTAFCGLFADYIFRVWKSPSRQRLGGRMAFFLSFLFLSTFLILLRCVYRVVELHEGYFSELFRDEPLFIALESGIMCAATLTLNIGHPSIALGASTTSLPRRKLESRDSTDDMELGSIRNDHLAQPEEPHKNTGYGSSS